MRCTCFTAQLLAAVVLIFQLVAPGSARAHPHVFVDSDLELVFDADGLAGFQQTWTFDEMFSAMILEDFDTDADGALSAAEVLAVRDGAFANVKQWNYFTHVTIGGRDFAVRQVTDFDAGVVKGRLQYRFFTPCPAPCPTTPGSGPRVTVTVFDPDYYADFLPPALDHVAVTGGEGWRVALDQYKDPRAVFSQWMITPTVVEVRFSRP